MSQYEAPRRRKRLTLTTTGSEYRLFNPAREIEAAMQLLPQPVTEILKPHMQNGEVTMKMVNDNYFPSIIIRDDGTKPIETSLLVANGITALTGNRPIFIEHGPAATVSTEVGALYRGPNAPITIGTEPGFGMFSEAGFSYLAGDNCDSVHPALNLSREGVFTLMTPLTTEQLLGNTSVFVAGVRSIAPTPGTVRSLFDAVKDRLTQNGTLSLVLSEVRTNNENALADREDDINAIYELSREDFDLIDFTLPTNNLTDLQHGKPEKYADPVLADALAVLGPFDSNSMSIGVHPDPQVPPPQARIIVLRKKEE